MKLRQYQEDAVRAVMDAIEGGEKRVLYTLATGCGKTQIFCELTRRLNEKGHRVLILVHRVELLNQAVERLQTMNGLDSMQIGTEISVTHSNGSEPVIVGMVQTLGSFERMQEILPKPTVVITDEAHHVKIDSQYDMILKYLGEETIHIGCTATPKRLDRSALVCKNQDGSPVMLFDKKKRKTYPADPKNTPFERICYEYNILQAMQEGWLTGINALTVKTGTDLSKIKTRAGDFAQNELAKAVDNAKRTVEAINAWKQIPEHNRRRTMVFCVNVEHAKHSAELWEQAGIKANYLDGETHKNERARVLEQFRRGEIEVLCNCGLFTEGFDFPMIDCVVLLRPTQSWALYMQMIGRGTRSVIDLSGYETSQERIEAIKGSDKPYVTLLDVVDIREGKDLVSAPAILDLAPDLNLQGHSLLEAKELMDTLETEEVKKRIIGECPVDFEALKVLIEQVDLLNYHEAVGYDWAVTAEGDYKIRRGLPLGYDGRMMCVGEGRFELVVTYAKTGEVILHNKTADGCEWSGEAKDFSRYLSSAQKRIEGAVDRHRNSLPKGTLQALTEKQIRCLKANSHTEAEIDAMTYGYAKKLIARYMEDWNRRKVGVA